MGRKVQAEGTRVVGRLRYWQGGSRGPAPHQPGSMREFSMPSQKPWWGHGHASLSLGREGKKLELGGAGMVQGWGVPGHMQWA